MNAKKVKKIRKALRKAGHAVGEAVPKWEASIFGDFVQRVLKANCGRALYRQMKKAVAAGRHLKYAA